MRESMGETAVVLDDQPLWLEAMGNLLDRLGMAVVGAVRSTKDALEAIEQHKPDVFVLDVELGGQTDEMLACVRSARALDGDLKVVALGSQARTDEVEAAFGAGASVFCAAGRVKTFRAPAMLKTTPLGCE
jgi:DNA-binding NarL/FixJ family response regulator